MSRLVARRGLIALVLFGALSLPGFGQEDPYRANLKGLKTVSVLVEQLDDAARNMGLSEDAIQTDVELKLKLAGMRVVAMQEGAKLPGAPYVYVNVTMTHDAGAAAVYVELDQDATLKRNSQSATGLGTWFEITVIEHPDSQGIRNRIGDLTDMLVKDWVAANRKP